MTLGEWLETWMELYILPSGLAESTKSGYNRSVRACPPALASIDLQELTPLNLRRWLLAVASVYPRAAQLDQVMLSRSLTIAAKCGLCRPGLVDSDVLPPIEHTPAKAVILNTEQLQAYMAAAAATDVAPLLMLMCCGLRRGEAMGARWENIDLKAGTLLVDGQRSRVDQKQPAPLKSAAARRLVELPPVLVAVLRRWPRDFTGWVCTCGAHKLYTVHRRLLREQRLPEVTLHGLRHSFATAAAAGGIPIKVLQVALGHAKYQLTADLYADHLPSICAVPRSIFTA